MRISMPRGDIRLVRFLVNDQDDLATGVDFTEIYFTVKRSAKDHDFIFQKRLSAGEIEKLGPGDYQLRINPEDTNNLVINSPKFPYYVFDIQLDFDGESPIKETFVGTFVLTEEVTYAENE